VCVCVCVLAATVSHPLLAVPLSSNYSSRGWSGLSLSLTYTHSLSRALIFRN
jgi:hypothetical protein